MQNNSFVLISAATSDIGKTITQKLACSYNLLLHGRDEGKLNELVFSIKTDKTIKTVVLDLLEINDLSYRFQSFLNNNDILISAFVHCAGTLKILPFKNFRLDYCNEIFNVNFFSAIEISKSLLLKSNKGKLENIIFISAVYSKFGNIGNSIYASSKGALDSLVKSLALELAPKVRVNSILPGAVKTKMTDKLFDIPNVNQMMGKQYPLGFGSTDDIANMVEFLISDKARWITGQNYFVDGGRSCI
jgi:NAD(P)-dependent dehydrogenase (short-subunit alcohol dehydrogenase family)